MGGGLRADSKLASGKRLLQTIKRGNWEIKDEEGKSVAGGVLAKVAFRAGRGKYPNTQGREEQR